MWQELEIKTTHQAYPAINNILSEFGAEGIYKEKVNAKKELAEIEIIIKAYFNQQEFIEQFAKLKESILTLKDYDIDLGAVEFKVSKVKLEDWANNWKENFKPFSATDSLVIKPTWEDYQVKTGEIIIEIDPGQAFGTGQHETTISSLRLLEEHLKPDSRLLDLGTGTGILAIAGAKLGVEKITALDIDPVAVKTAQENAKLNQVEQQIEFLQGDLVTEIKESYNLVVANILPEVLKILIPDLKDVCSPKARVILSGIVLKAEADILKLLQKENFIIEDVVYNGEWVTVSALNYGVDK